LDYFSSAKAEVVKSGICSVTSLRKGGLGHESTLLVLGDKRVPAETGILDLDPEDRPWLEAVLTQSAFCNQRILVKTRACLA
jgi:hypothetical protein